jgi:predicted nucleic acid-binding protein
MMEIVVDTSVIFGFAFEDEINRYTDSLMESFESYIPFVPSIFPIEVANVLLIHQKHNRWSSEKVEKFLRILNGYLINIEPPLPINEIERIIEVSSRHDLTVYDAIYLDLAIRKNCKLATLDKALIKAAKKEGVYWQ